MQASEETLSLMHIRQKEDPRMIKRLNLRNTFASFFDIYNAHEDRAKGRLISLGSALITAFILLLILVGSPYLLPENPDSPAFRSGSFA